MRALKNSIMKSAIEKNGVLQACAFLKNYKVAKRGKRRAERYGSLNACVI